MIVKYHEYTIQISTAQLQPVCHQSMRGNIFNRLTMSMNSYDQMHNGQNTKHQEKGRHRINSFNNRDKYYYYYYLDG